MIFILYPIEPSLLFRILSIRPTTFNTSGFSFQEGLIEILSEIDLLIESGHFLLILNEFFFIDNFDIFIE